ncbi:hypothetical protein GQ457_15G011330 [Hibiscus cannabinus]
MGVTNAQGEMQGLLDKFEDVFQPPSGLPPWRRTDHAIHVEPGKKPVNVKPYHYPHFQKGEIEKQVQQMLGIQIIQHNSSPYSSPVLLVKKKDGYHQIRVREEDVPKTAFRTHKGHYEFRVMPFDLTNAPSTFQATMNEVFRQFLRKFVLVFLDDILIYSREWSEHLGHVHQVLQVLRENGFVAKKYKCTFRQDRVGYLGHVITRDGLTVDPDKVEAIKSWPTPKNVKGKSLRELTTHTIQTPEQQRWLSRLIGYDFEICYHPGRLNNAVDALSREVGVMLMAFTQTTWGVINVVRRASAIDSELLDIRAKLQEGDDKYQGYSEQGGILLNKGRVIVPKEVALRSLLLREYHQSVSGGHAGILRTFQRLAANFFWKGMRADVKKMVGECQDCQRMKSESLSPAGLLQPLPIPEQVFEDVSLDFINGLPRSNGKEDIMVVVDRLTKYGHFFSLLRQYDSLGVARVMIQGVVKLHGIPRTMVSDRDKVF